MWPDLGLLRAPHQQPHGVFVNGQEHLLNIHPQPGIEWPGAWASSAHGFKS